MKKLLMLLSMSLSLFGFSFSQSISEYQGEIRYVFVDVARVRFNPQIDSKIQDALPVGHKMYIVEKTNESYKLNGFNDFWYKVKYEQNSQMKQGYIWGGLLSQKSEIYNNNLLILGVFSFKENEGFISGVKLISNQKVISNVSFVINYFAKPSEIPDLEMNLYDNLGYRSIQAVIKVSLNSKLLAMSSYESNNRNIIIINNDQLFLMAVENFRGEGGVGSSYEKYIFPKEKGGVENFIIYRNIITKFSEEKNKDITIKNETIRYVLENNKLVKSK